MTGEALAEAEVPDAEAGEPGRPLAGSLAATGLIQLLQAATAVVLARALGPQGRGALAAVLLWPTVIMALGNLGLAQATTYLAARSRRLGTVVGSAFALVAVDSLLLIGIGFLVIPLALSGHGTAIVATSRAYLVAFIPLSLLGLGMMSVLNGLHRFAWFQALRVLLALITLAGVLGLTANGALSIRSAAVVYGGAYLITALIATVVVLVTVGASVRVSLATARNLLSFGLKSQLSTTMWALNERVDQLAISVFLSAASLGLYVVAVNLTSLTAVVGFSFALVALPLLARMPRGEERRRAARAIAGATIVAGALVSVPILIAEPLLVRVLFGSGFGGAVDVGRVLLIAAMIFALNRVLEAVLQAAGRPLDSSLGEALGLAVTAAGLALLLPTIGILGAGLTSLLAYLTSAVFLARRAARALELPVARLLIPDTAVLLELVRKAIGGAERSHR